MILAPRGGRGIIEGIPNRDDRWREKFFVFKINSASVGDFDFKRIPREWSDDIERQREVDFEELRKTMAATEAEKIIAQSDLNSMEEKYRREIEGRDKKARKDLHLARVSLAKEYEGYIEGGFELEAELERLKDLEISLEVDYGLASVSDISLGCLDLPEISGDSVNQD
ncbi:hypothetical protein DY000_02027217 [Brassica cretica]|uniref:Uncharacterized protein n=1 Tax=Brassica cretica TaxID=69181 RepID=A0ABQ7EEE7_BRACR|nr:hypothetical protein DY000_02027217 [Brassica cretica]